MQTLETFTQEKVIILIIIFLTILIILIRNVLNSGKQSRIICKEYHQITVLERFTMLDEIALQKQKKIKNIIQQKMNSNFMMMQQKEKKQIKQNQWLLMKSLRKPKQNYQSLIYKDQDQIMKEKKLIQMKIKQQKNLIKSKQKQEKRIKHQKQKRIKQKQKQEKKKLENQKLQMELKEKQNKEKELKNENNRVNQIQKKEQDQRKSILRTKNDDDQNQKKNVRFNMADQQGQNSNISNNVILDTKKQQKIFGSKNSNSQSNKISSSFVAPSSQTDPSSSTLFPPVTTNQPSNNSLFPPVTTNQPSNNSLFAPVTTNQPSISTPANNHSFPPVMTNQPSNNPFPPVSNNHSLPTVTTNQPSNNPFPPVTTNQPSISTPAVSNNHSLPTVTTNQPSTSTSINHHTDINSQQHLLLIMKYGERKINLCQIATHTNNLSGARSNLQQVWKFCSSILQTINLNKKEQVDTFSQKIFHQIVHILLKGSNIKGGIQRIPPKDLTKQVQKNSLNSYILIINLFRIIGLQCVWLHIFGKTLKLLQCIFHPTRQIKSFKDLELLTNKFIEFQGDNLEDKYISRVDFLSYFLFGLTTYDPILVYQEFMHRNNKQSIAYREILSYKHQWSYTQFWCLFNELIQNKQQYFKPIIYMNILSAIYLQIRQNKMKKRFNNFAQIYSFLIKLGKQFFKNLNKNKQIQLLKKQNQQTSKYSFDGQDFIRTIKVLSNRFNQKQNQYQYLLQKFMKEASIFYYFK